MAPKKATAQATLDGFTGSSPKRGAKRQADGQFIAPDTKKPKVETGGESASSSSKRVQGMKNAQGDLGEKATAAELADGMETPYAELLRTIEEGSKNKIEPKGDVVVQSVSLSLSLSLPHSLFSRQLKDEFRTAGVE